MKFAIHSQCMGGGGSHSTLPHTHILSILYILLHACTRHLARALIIIILLLRESERREKKKRVWSARAICYDAGAMHRKNKNSRNSDAILNFLRLQCLAQHSPCIKYCACTLYTTAGPLSASFLVPRHQYQQSQTM